jgi:hypothetical protein
MLDSGSFVLYSKDNSIIWETFKYPTDTILALESPFVFCGDFCEVERAIGNLYKKINRWVLISKGVEIEEAKERSLEEGWNGEFNLLGKSKKVKR